MNNDIEVTVLMSMYNTPIDQLKKSIESILKQTYKNFEFLIINDGSNDECFQFIQSYSDERIRLVNNEKNIGLEKSLNKGILMAKGRYIVRMDTDDIAYSNRIEKQLEYIKNNPNYSIVGTQAYYFNKNGIYGKSFAKGEITVKELLKGTPFIHPSLIINKDHLKKIGGYPEYSRCEDYAMELELYSNGFKGYIMDDILMMYRMDDMSYKKRSLKKRVLESKMKIKYFKKMKVSVLDYRYAVKPILAAIIPSRIIQKYHKIKLKID